MEQRIKTFVLEFFTNIGSTIIEENSVFTISNVSKEVCTALGKEAPYRLCFESNISEGEYVSKESPLFAGIVRYLKENGKTALLKIDFDVDPLEKIKKAVSLNNCDISNVVKKDRKYFFSRFTFMTTFNYLNESEKLMKEIYVHNGEIVEGDLSGYHVVEGKQSEASGDHLERDYVVAKDHLKAFLETKTAEIGNKLSERLETETERIKAHYSRLLGELGGDLQDQLEKIKEIEEGIRTATDEEREGLLAKLERLRKSLLKIGDDDSKSRILKEQAFTIKDAVHKHSLAIDNSLVNTTVIYYPVYCFNLFLKRDSSGRFLDMVYDPLRDRVESISCESCKKKITKLNLCSSGHISCDACVAHCDDCGSITCGACYTKSCSTCGKIACKSCVRVCRGCGSYVCGDHLRADGVTGEMRCLNCLRPCLRCHGLTEPRYFGEAIDGSKVCQKCLGKERRKGAMKELFSRD